MNEGEAPRRPTWARIAMVGGLATGAAIVATALARAVLVRILNVPSGFRPASAESVFGFTLMGAVAAALVFAVIARRAQHPKRTYWRIAWVALALSFLPDFMLFSPRAPFEEVSVAGVAALMLLHVVAFAVIVPILQSANRIPATRAPAGETRASD